MRGESRALAVGLVLAITMNAFEVMAVVTAMPAVAADLGGGHPYGAAFSVYMLAHLVALVFAGEQADPHGPAPPPRLGIVPFAIGLPLPAPAPSSVPLVIGR